MEDDISSRFAEGYKITINIVLVKVYLINIEIYFHKILIINYNYLIILIFD